MLLLSAVLGLGVGLAWGAVERVAERNPVPVETGPPAVIDER